MRGRLAAAVVAALLVPGVASAGGSTPAIAEGKGTRLLGWSQLPYAEDVATTEVGGRTLAVPVSIPFNRPAELQVVDVTSPARPRVLSTLRCASNLNDVSATADPHVVAVMVSGETPCLGVEGFGLALVDLSNPRRPVVAASAAREPSQSLPNPRNPWPWANPSLDAHPTAPYLYTTRVVEGRGELVTWEMSAGGLEPVSTLELPSEPRDLAIQGEGSLLAVAMGHAFATVDLADPAAPELIAVSQCPGCFLVTEVEFAGRLGLVVSDRSANPASCPSGTLYFYSVELGYPVLYSVYNPSVVEPDPSEEPLPRVCDVDDLDVSPNGNLALLTWHRNSVRLLYIGSAFGAGATGTGSGRVEELGWFRIDKTWSQAARFVDDERIVALDQNWGLTTIGIEPCAYRFAC